MSIDPVLVNSVTEGSLTSTVTDKSESTTYAVQIDSIVPNDTKDENTISEKSGSFDQGTGAFGNDHLGDKTVSKPLSKRKNESQNSCELPEPKRLRQGTSSLESIEPNVALTLDIDTMAHDFDVIEPVSLSDASNVESCENVAKTHEAGKDEIKTMLQTKDYKMVEIWSSTSTLRIKFENGLTYESNLARDLAPAELQEVSNLLEKMTVDEFRCYTSQAFSFKNKKLAKAGNKRQKPIFSSAAAKLNNFKALEFGDIRDKCNVKSYGWDDGGDCIQFTWKTKEDEVTKKVIVTKYMVIRISLPIYALEYQMKLTSEISSADLRNLLKFVDQKGKKDWLDSMKHTS
ncbi:uncharacterized protein LOC129574387 [Sitodiplosis mosellana]|uniref:uncharacterized protein LOC129574387 n=1 Tax=Sitodiplosis mosellana TaxID=263140 RepID=UPI0024453608|nr:uncharacterized protein LOC129574387 [Sitodiplosis mosellana]